MAVVATQGLNIGQGADHIRQNAHDPSSGDCAMVHARKGSDQDANTSGADVEDMLLPLKVNGIYRFEFDLIYKTQQQVLSIGGMQCCMVFDGELVEMGYTVWQALNPNTAPYSETTLEAGNWLGHASIGPGPAYRGFRIVGGLKVGLTGGYLKARFRSVGVLGLGNPIATLNANCTAVAFEC